MGPASPLATGREDDTSIVAVAAGGTINLAAGVLNAALGFGFTILVARRLGAGGAGSLFEAIGIFSVLELVCELGAVAAIVRAVSRHKALGQPSELRMTILVAIAPCALLACLVSLPLLISADRCASLVARHGDGTAVAAFLRVFAIALPASVVGDILLGATRGLGTMLPSAVIDSVLKPTLRLGFVFVILLVTKSAVPIGVGWAIPIAVSLVLAARSLSSGLSEAMNCYRTRNLQNGPKFRSVARGFWGFALPQSVASILQVALVWVDVLLLGALRSTEDAGTYATLSRYLLVGTLGLSAVALAIAPVMSRLLSQEQFTRAEDVYRTATAWVIASAFPIYLTMAVFAPVLMRLFGRSFYAGADPLALLSIAMLGNALTGPAAMILLMGGRSGAILLDSAVSLAINVILNVLLIPAYGMTGAAVAWSVAIIAMNALAVAQVWLTWRIHPFGHSMGSIAGFSILLYGALGLFFAHVFGENSIALSVACLLGSMLYGVVLWRARQDLELNALWGAFKARLVARVEVA